MPFPLPPQLQLAQLAQASRQRILILYDFYPKHGNFKGATPSPLPLPL